MIHTSLTFCGRTPNRNSNLNPNLQARKDEEKRVRASQDPNPAPLVLPTKEADDLQKALDMLKANTRGEVGGTGVFPPVAFDEIMIEDTEDMEIGEFLERAG